MNAIISVFDKTFLKELSTYLIKKNYKIWSSGGTFQYLKTIGNLPKDNLFKISDYTGFPEILNGRVKTLNPKIYGGILADLENKNHKKELEEHKLHFFNLVVVNLYPFEEIISKEHTEEDAIENIDIGGVSLIRAGAKNYKNVSVLINPSQYDNFINSKIDNKQLGMEAFQYVTNYDQNITSYFNKDIIYRTYTNPIKLKYGLNPQQKDAKIYEINNNPLPFKIINGKPGYINVMDALQSYNLVKEVKNTTGYNAVTSFKHTAPTGLAITTKISKKEKEYFNIKGNKSDLSIAYLRARNIDPLSSFGDFVAISGKVDIDTAKFIKREISDGIIASDYSKEALEILKSKKNGKFIILKANDYIPNYEYKEMSGLTLGQQINKPSITKDFFSKCVTINKHITNNVKLDLIIASILLKYTPSNSISFAYNGQVLGVGAGQQNRIECVKLAGNKMKTFFLRKHPDIINLRRRLLKEKKLKRQEIINIEYEEINKIKNKKEYLNTEMKDISLSSDAFLPFDDNITIANEYNVKYITNPGGSIRDETVIKKANDFNMVMFITNRRLFLH